jgi:hypothetical protein
MTEETKLLIPFAGTKVSTDHLITDDHTAGQVQTLIRGLSDLMSASG